MKRDLRPGEVRLSLHGPNVSREAIEEAAGHLQTLLRELTREATGDPDAIKWELGPLRIVCDGCDRDRPEIHDDWIYRDGDDLCPDCQARES